MTSGLSVEYTFLILFISTFFFFFDDFEDKFDSSQK